MTMWSRASLSAVLGVVVGVVLQATHHHKRRVEIQADHLSADYIKMLSSLASIVEARDRHTQGHCERVATNALVMGRALGFNSDCLDDLYWSALLHDLGKIAIPETILLKKGPLTPAEFTIVKRHPDYGADLLVSVSTRYTKIATVVRAHHERYDGAGYPQGLRGTAIPLMSRIISIVDVYEALTSRRPYRKPMSCDEALDYLSKSAAGQFDPALIPVFEQCYARGDILCSSPHPFEPVELEYAPGFRCGAS